MSLTSVVSQRLPVRNGIRPGGVTGAAALQARCGQSRLAILYELIVLYNYGMSAQPIGPADEHGVIELPASEARSRISELLDAVADGEFIYLTRRGKRVAALMPADVAENYERLEDEYWARRAAEARSRLASGEDEVIAFDQMVAEAEGASGQA
jgi:prevent-host-death family protein